MDRPSSKSSKEPTPPREAAEPPERWSAQRKTELVLRLLRGELLDSVSRESQVPAHEVESWHRAFLESGTRGLQRHTDPEERELVRTRAKLGEVMMRLELADRFLFVRQHRRHLRTPGRDLFVELTHADSSRPGAAFRARSATGPSVPPGVFCPWI